MSRRVLVVDDEKGIREALTQVLEYEDIEVRACGSGSEALQLYAELRPHLGFEPVTVHAEVLRRIPQADEPGQQLDACGSDTHERA